MTTNLRQLNPIQQIVSQKIPSLEIETSEKSYCETDLMLFEDEKIGIDMTVEIYFKTDPNGKEVKKIKSHVWNVYNGENCEDVVLTEVEKRMLEKYLSENLIISLP